MHNHSYEIEFNLHMNEILFSYDRMGTKTRFEKEAKDNSEMALLSPPLLEGTSNMIISTFLITFVGHRWTRNSVFNVPFTSVGFSFPKRPLLLTTGATLSCSLPSLRFLANRPCAFSRLLPKLPSPLFNSFSDSSLREDFKAGIQTPASSKCPSPSV